MDEYESAFDALSDVIRRYYKDRHTAEIDLEALFRDLVDVLEEDGWNLVLLAVREHDTPEDVPEYYYYYYKDYEWDETYYLLSGLLERIKKDLLDSID